MNFKTTYILFGILFAALGLFLLTQLLGKKSTEETAYVLPSMHDKNVEPKDITALDIETFAPRKPEKIVLTRRDQGWQMQQPNVRADRFVVNQVVEEIYRAAKEENADVKSDLQKFGLEPPSAVVTLKRGVEGEWRLNIGAQSSSREDAVVYVTSSDRPKDVMAVRRSQLRELFAKETVASKVKEGEKEVEKTEEKYRFKTLNDFRSRELLAGEGIVNFPEAVTQVNLQQPNQPSVVLKRGDDGRWRFQEPKLGDADYDGAGGTEQKPPTGVRELLKDISELRVSSTKVKLPKGAEQAEEESTPDFVAGDVQDMAQYGLEAERPATLKIEVTRKPPAAATGEEQQPPVREELLVGKKVEDKYYARLGNENAVVKVVADKLEPILEAAKKPDALRSRDLVLVEQAKVDAIDLKNATGLIKLRRAQPANWKLLGGDSKEARNAEYQSVQQLLTALTTRRQVTAFPEPAKEAELGFDKPDAAVVSLWVDGLEKEEKKPEQSQNKDKDAKKEGKKEAKPAEPELKLKDEKHPTVRLTFGKRDEKQVYVRREEGGEKALVAVPVSVFEKVSQGLLAYLDRTLPSFSDKALVVKLVLESDGRTYEVEKEQKDDKTLSGWKFKQPKDLAGQQAQAQRVEQMISELRSLHTDKLVAEKGSDNELATYGLKPPQIKATVTVQKEDKKTDDHAYFFGKETAGGFYAKQGERDLVFIIAPHVVQTLRGELRDPAVFHFVPSLVKELKLTGWRKGANLTLQVERQHPRPPLPQIGGGKSGGWTVKQPSGFDLDHQKVEAFVGGLADLKAERFVTPKTGAKSEYQLDEKSRALHIQIVVEGQKTPYTLTIGARDAKDEAYYAQSSTLPHDVFLLPQSRFEKVLSGINYFSKHAEAGK